MLTNLFLGQTAEEKNFIEDLFSCYLYTGNGSTQTITNGIDLAGKGGLVWVKARDWASSHSLNDTARGTLKWLGSNDTLGQQNQSGGYGAVSAYNATGFSLNTTYNETNGSGINYASWTFRKAPKFFDVVTYTGDGNGPRNINHSLGVAPGMIIIKSVSNSRNWAVYHRSLGVSKYMFLEATTAEQTTGAGNYWESTVPTATQFTVGAGYNVNANGETYVAYLFAHDTTADGLIQCGSFTANGSGQATVNLGFEPQSIILKATDQVQDWFILDNMRGMSQTNNQLLRPNTSGAEQALSGGILPTSTGFYSEGSICVANKTYIYLAIRRGPMRVPTDATKVFSPDIGSSTGIFDSNFPVDLFLRTRRSDGINITSSRLQGDGTYIRTYSTAAEATGGGDKFDSNTSLYFSGGADLTGWIAWLFRRAPGFFDVVCYTGTGAARTVSHNLGVAPELIITKGRSGASTWGVYSKTLGSGYRLELQSTSSSSGSPIYFDSDPTTTNFSISSNSNVNSSGTTYVAYLFASCPGVSKVFSFTGNGSSQNIDCGFTNGARFVLIKRTDSTGSWYVWDTARGIISADDPYLQLNSTAAEVTTDDSIDPLSTGFTVNQTSSTNVNVNGASYVGLAIA